MGANRFGQFFSVTSFGESHGRALGAVIEGCPAGLQWDPELLRVALARRRPGQSSLVSARDEADVPEVLSGVFEGRTLGTPIAILVRNTDARSSDYVKIAQEPRPGHADDVWKDKYGHVDPRGGGRSSGRETVARVMAGAVARMFCRSEAPELRVIAWSAQIGPISLSANEISEQSENLLRQENWVDQFSARLPNALKANEVEELLTLAKLEGRSFGGIAALRAVGVPRGLGQPVFHKLKADLASAMLGIGATNGIEFGAGFESSAREGSEFHKEGQGYGGIRGGISTGEDLDLRVSFKPTSSVLDVAKTGRHDPCIVPRAVPVIEAMTWLVLADHLLARRLDRATDI